MTTKQTQIENLKNQIANARRIQWNASQMRNAAGVFNCQRELETLYRKLDSLTR
jgi:hypothetical protein